VFVSSSSSSYSSASASDGNASRLCNISCIAGLISCKRISRLLQLLSSGLRRIRSLNATGLGGWQVVRRRICFTGEWKHQNLLPGPPETLKLCWHLHLQKPQPQLLAPHHLRVFQMDHFPKLTHNHSTVSCTQDRGTLPCQQAMHLHEIRTHPEHTEMR
jgi:hypothetical protein